MNLRKPPHPNSYWVLQGQLLAGEYPGSREDAETRAKLRGLLEYGVRTFIDLTEPGELRPYASILEEEALKKGVSATHHRFAVRDLSVPQKATQMSEILDAVEASLCEERLPYIHCWGGAGRTGVVVGCLFVRRGLGGDEALAELAGLWSGVAKAPRKPDSPETEEQRSYVRSWSELERDI